MITTFQDCSLYILNHIRINLPETVSFLFKSVVSFFSKLKCEDSQDFHILTVMWYMHMSVSFVLHNFVICTQISSTRKKFLPLEKQYLFFLYFDIYLDVAISIHFISEISESTPVRDKKNLVMVSR